MRASQDDPQRTTPTTPVSDACDYGIFVNISAETGVNTNEFTYADEQAWTRPAGTKGLTRSRVSGGGRRASEATAKRGAVTGIDARLLACFNSVQLLVQRG